jgi:hypothetical protein
LESIQIKKKIQKQVLEEKNSSSGSTSSSEDEEEQAVEEPTQISPPLVPQRNHVSDNFFNISFSKLVNLLCKFKRFKK